MIDKNLEQQFQRVTVFLNRQQIDYLDKMGKDALFHHGNKLSRIKIISALVNLMIELDIDSENVASVSELQEKIKEKLNHLKVQGKVKS